MLAAKVGSPVHQQKNFHHGFWTCCVVFWRFVFCQGTAVHRDEEEALLQPEDGRAVPTHELTERV
ncbi:unnamed protein product [Amoebophrya sp. A120]|nr:unnamed protein product [Amoebophrya sp. A120]|eukprot:GSA120T00006657001.1